MGISSNLRSPNSEGWSYETLGSPSRKRRASSFKPLPYVPPHHR
ncbi:hypothetical protein ACFPRL_35590 [Pseudoclavibacter helvolus]